jgi:hypothetical protein
MMSLPWSEHAQNDEDTGRSVASIPWERGGGVERGNRDTYSTYSQICNDHRHLNFAIMWPSGQHLTVPTEGHTQNRVIHHHEVVLRNG